MYYGTSDHNMINQFDRISNFLTSSPQLLLNRVVSPSSRQFPSLNRLDILTKKKILRAHTLPATKEAVMNIINFGVCLSQKISIIKGV